MDEPTSIDKNKPPIWVPISRRIDPAWWFVPIGTDFARFAYVRGVHYLGEAAND